MDLGSSVRGSLLGAGPSHTSSPSGALKGRKQRLLEVKSQVTLLAVAVSVGSPLGALLPSPHPPTPVGARTPTPTLTGANDPLAQTQRPSVLTSPLCVD